MSQKQEEEEKPPSNAINIAIMGPSGTGKSTFVNLVSGAQLKVGHGLSSCTQDVLMAPSFQLDSRTINLIDTPGFDDTDRSEVQILKTIASYLIEQCTKEVKLQGVIYLHNIDANRMGGVSKRAFELFRKICGTETLSNVSIVTTKWDKVTEEEGSAREKELKDQYFEAALKEGARMYRHNNDKESANQLLRVFLATPTIPLCLQQKMVDESKPVFDTKVGPHVETDLKKLNRKAEENQDVALRLEGYRRDESEILESRAQKPEQDQHNEEKASEPKVEGRTDGVSVVGSTECCAVIAATADVT
ncbi:P-loop containing nucleoside triphosphate hydrolase protein [Collybia nuda]|uniref:P-loop containing nucleoside triphosphate hydrolase protein n=1 Tax=Collybia nuda TaxID=64659 RepID=A0A9P5YC95_9AGAR|nr:P-loop containing nucleoside triphosphate hydrolase protein [Collybia nuda]